jgi:hypothetical protein
MLSVQLVRLNRTSNPTRTKPNPTVTLDKICWYSTIFLNNFIKTASFFKILEDISSQISFLCIYEVWKNSFYCDIDCTRFRWISSQILLLNYWEHSTFSWITSSKQLFFSKFLKCRFHLSWARSVVMTTLVELLMWWIVIVLCVWPTIYSQVWLA